MSPRQAEVAQLGCAVTFWKLLGYIAGRSQQEAVEGRAVERRGARNEEDDET